MRRRGIAPRAIRIRAATHPRRRPLSPTVVRLIPASLAAGRAPVHVCSDGKFDHGYQCKTPPFRCHCTVYKTEKHRHHADSRPFVRDPRKRATAVSTVT
eukprot:2070762-Prymnesium_polylepis.1